MVQERRELRLRQTNKKETLHSYSVWERNVDDQKQTSSAVAGGGGLATFRRRLKTPSSVS